jgi:hypothetical protein
MSDEIYDGVDGEDVANLYDELYTLATDYANAKSTEQAKFKKKYPKKYGTIRRLLVNEIHSSNKAEGGLVSLAVGGDIGSEDDDAYSGLDSESYDDYTSADEGAMGASGIDSGSDDGGSSDESIEVAERGDVFGVGPTQYGKDFTQQQINAYTKEVDRNPQLRGFLGKEIKRRIGQGDFELERNKDGLITGVYSDARLPGVLGGLASILGLPTSGRVYTGYGKGSEIPDSGDSGEEPSKMIRKIVEEKKKKEDTPLTEAELDYFGRGLGTASKPMKTLADINEFIGGLYKDTTSPTGAKLSKDKRYLTLPNGKVLDLRTGRRVESLEGLELFTGGRI